MSELTDLRILSWTAIGMRLGRGQGQYLELRDVERLLEEVKKRAYEDGYRRGQDDLTASVLT